MITYRFISQTFLGQTVKVQYSKYDSNTRIDLGSGTFPFEYTTDQKGGTYYFYIPSVDRTFRRTIEIPPIDIIANLVDFSNCDISGTIEYVPSCDLDLTIIEVPVCDIDYDFALVSPTPTNSFSCPSISGVTVGPIEISGGQEYTLADNPTSVHLYQFNTSNDFITSVPPFSNSILPDSLFVDEIMVLVPEPYWIGGPCQYCFNINLGIEVPCVSVTSTSTPTPTVTPTPTITPTETLTPTVTPPSCQCITWYTYDYFVTISGITCAGSTVIDVNYAANSTATQCFKIGTFAIYGEFANTAIVVTGGSCNSIVECLISESPRPTRTQTQTPSITPSQQTPTLTPTNTQTPITPTPTPTGKV
jgi:hypothetical protein